MFAQFFSLDDIALWVWPSAAASFYWFMSSRGVFTQSYTPDWRYSVFSLLRVPTFRKRRSRPSSRWLGHEFNGEAALDDLDKVVRPLEVVVGVVQRLVVQGKELA